MQIKSYTRAVDPNTTQGQVQAPANPAAYGSSTAGSDSIINGLGAANKQIQAYIDDQMNLSVLDATNKYEAGLNDLLHNPDTGLFTKQDVNAMDLMKQYQDAEQKLRRQAFDGLPNYRKAHETFAQTAQTVNMSKLSSVMQYQYQKGEERRADTLNTSNSNIVDRGVEDGDRVNIYNVYSQLEGVYKSLYGNIWGADKLNQNIKQARTKALKSIVVGLLANNDEGSFQIARNLLKNSSTFVDDTALLELNNTVNAKQKANETTSDIEQAIKNHPGDPEGAKKEIRDKNTITETVTTPGGIGSGNWFEANADYESKSSGGYDAYNNDSGAFGKYQFIPSTWKWVCEKTGVSADDHSKEAQDKNAKWYWDYLKGQVGGSDEATVVAWNWGEQNGKRWAEGLPTGIDDNGQEFRFDQPHDGNPAVTERIAKIKSMAGASGSLVDAGFEYSKQSGLLGTEMNNRKNGCAEFVGKFGASYSPFLANQAKNNVVSVPQMVENAQKPEFNIPVVDFDEKKLNKGDCIVYKTNEGNYGHITIYDGQGGYYGNSSSTGDNGMAIHGDDYNIPGMTPQCIIKTGADGMTGPTTQTVTRERRSETELQAIDSEIDRRYALEKRMKQEAIEAKRKTARDAYQTYLLENPNATETDKEAKLTEIVGDDPDLKTGEVGLMLINQRSAVKRAAEMASHMGSSRGGGEGTGSGSRSGADIVARIIDMIGVSFHSMDDITAYCGNDIILSQSQINTISKAMNDYRSGKGAWNPDYEVSLDTVANASGIDKDVLESNWPVIKRMAAQQAAERKANGEEISYSQLIQLYINNATSNGVASPSQLEAAGIKRIEKADDEDYLDVTFNDGNTYEIYKGEVNKLLSKQITEDEISETRNS